MLGSGLWVPARCEIVERALKARFPSVFNQSQWAEAGGLMSYGFNFPWMWRRGAEMLAAILRGAKAGDIPIEQPTRFELVIIASGKSRKGGRDVVTRKPFIAVQRVRLPPGKGEPASRKQALRGWWQHHSRSVGSRRLSPAVAPI